MSTSLKRLHVLDNAHRASAAGPLFYMTESSRETPLVSDMALGSTKTGWSKAWDNAVLASGILLAILKLLWIPLSWLLFILLRSVLIVTTPFKWLGVFLYRCMQWPIAFLARFETLYYYFGTACIIGLLTGTILYCSTQMIFQVLHMYDQPEATSNTKQGRTAASYRAERAQKQAEHGLNQLRLNDLPLPSDSEFKADSKGWSPSGALARHPLSPAVEKNGLLSTTIFEEEDSSDYTTI